MDTRSTTLRKPKIEEDGDYSMIGHDTSRKNTFKLRDIKSEPDDVCLSMIDVFCGNAHGKMHLNMFFCPGIHSKCIDYKGRLISPKEFTIKGDKEKQKDWKGSIRIGRSSLRAHMEAGKITFHDHSNNCAGKCQSRNYVYVAPNKEETRKNKRILEVNREIEQSQKEGRELGNEKKPRGRPRKQKVQEEKTEYCNESVSDVYHPQINTSSIPFCDSNLVGFGPMTHSQYTPYFDVINCLQFDPQNFWNQLHRTGVAGHFCDDIIGTIVNLKQTIISSQLTPELATTLTRCTFALDMQTAIVQRVQAIERSSIQHNEQQKRFHTSQ